jgi:transcriptional regulator with XRE-family HTH domain
MINTEEFTKRLQEVIEYYGESASSFAEKIGVQRSSISHILSGRNKPSLEFILKILSAFPEVELYWLLNGKGRFPTSNKKESEINKPLSLDITEAKKEPPKDNLEFLIKNESQNNTSIDRIIIFYKDGTFKNYQN